MTTGCPKLCENQNIWRLDRTNGLPWWTRYRGGTGLVYQCSCTGCPESNEEGMIKLTGVLLEDNVWENGQMLLITIAREAGLTLGPNRKMQELMAERNVQILLVLAQADIANQGGTISENYPPIARLNEQYTQRIAQAAREYPDDGGTKNKGEGDHEEGDSTGLVVVVIILCTLFMLTGVSLATWLFMRRKRSMTATETFSGNEQVVIGSPVQLGDGTAEPYAQYSKAPVGAPVIVTANASGARSAKAP